MSLGDAKKERIMDLLERAIKKYEELKNDKFWNANLLDEPPILWFGNINSPREKVLTIGANPSNKEFECRERRFKIAYDWKTLPYVYDKKKRDRIYHSFVESYNDYFKNNPYIGWFGSEEKIQGVGTKLEAFLNGLDATFYEKKEYYYQAIHTDLFPFATKKKFSEIKERVMEDLFYKKECWAQRFLVDIIDLVNPKIIVLFGGKNTEVFEKAYKKCGYDIKKVRREKFDKYRYQLYLLDSYEVHTMSLYPPNVAKDTLALYELGKQFSENFIQKRNAISWF